MTIFTLLACLSGCQNPESYNNQKVVPYAMGPNQLPNNDIPDINVPVNVINVQDDSFVVEGDDFGFNGDIF